MDKIKLTGEDIEVGGIGKILLTPDELKAQLNPNLANLKEGDTVWVELKIEDLENGLWAHGVNLAIKREMKESDIVAVFPAEQEKEKREMIDKEELRKAIDTVRGSMDGRQFGLAIDTLVSLANQVFSGELVEKEDILALIPKVIELPKEEWEKMDLVQRNYIIGRNTALVNVHKAMGREDEKG